MFTKLDVIKKIEEKKQEVMDKYDSQIKEIEGMSNYVDIYTMLAKVYGNTLQQGEIAIKFLREYLDERFFKEFEAKRGANYVSFYNSEYKVHFSTSLSREIVIERIETLRKPYKEPSITENSLIYRDLLATYVNKPSFKNKKALIDVICQSDKRIISKRKIMTYLNRSYKKLKEELDSVNSRILCVENREIKYYENLEKFKTINAESLEFVKSLTFLRDFKEKNYYIFLVNIYDHEEYNTKTSW